MWIHEHRNWPDFTWDVQALADKLADIRHRQGRLADAQNDEGVLKSSGRESQNFTRS